MQVCGQAEETIVHLLAACPVLALTAYLYRHNLVAAVIHWHLSKVYSLPLSGGSWFTHQPLPVVEGSSAKLLWDFSLTSDYKHSANRPDIVLFDYQRQDIFFVEVSCPADINVTVKEDEKLKKYTSLAADFHQMYNMPVTIIPVVLGSTGIVSKHCLSFLKKIPEFSMRLFSHLQKATLIGTVRLLQSINFNV